MKAPSLLEHQLCSHPATVLIEVMRMWGMALKAVHPEINIQGSPERTVFRMVAEAKDGQYYIVAQIARRDLEKKKQIIRTLDFLSRQKFFSIQPYCVSPGREAILQYQGEHWQICPFVPGVNLDREKYIHERWRGPVLADFLLLLREKARGVPWADQGNPFSIKNYILDLLPRIRRHRPALLPEVAPAVQFLEKEFMSAHDAIPVSFCHGDYHPLNIIWSENGIRAVIDWEFLGYKPEIYDVGNLIGCLGMEHPSALAGDLVKSFIEQFQKAGVFASISWKYLLEFVVALRFAWLAEWLRKNDEEMIALELVYMKLLIDEQDSLRQEWGLDKRLIGR